MREDSVDTQKLHDDVDSASDKSHKVELLDVLVEGEPVTLYDQFLDVDGKSGEQFVYQNKYGTRYQSHDISKIPVKQKDIKNIQIRKEDRLSPLR